MTARLDAVAGGGGPGRVRTFWTTFRAVLTREVRWRMRGRRAFVVATVTVLLLGLLVFAVHQLLVQQALEWRRVDNGLGDLGIVSDGITAADSARIGRALFLGLLGVMTVLVVLIAPALASGVVSSEREKQTLELLVTSPISTLGLVMGKLVASLAYVLLLIGASLPLMSLVFTFGGVGPGDVARAYVLLLAVAFGSASIGLFLSALLGRTQLATLLAYMVMLALMLGTLALHTWWFVSSVQDEWAGGIRERRHAPEVLLWLNPVVADIDIACTALGETGGFCDYILAVRQMPEDPLDPPRDAFWPRSAIAWVVTGGALLLLSTQFISPTRRIRRPGRRAPKGLAERGS